MVFHPLRPEIALSLRGIGLNTNAIPQWPMAHVHWLYQLREAHGWRLRPAPSEVLTLVYDTHAPTADPAQNGVMRDGLAYR